MQIWIMYFLGVECHAISVLFKPQRSIGSEVIRIFQSPRFTFLKLASEMKLAASNLHVYNHTMKNLSDHSFWIWNLWGTNRCSGNWWCCFGVHTAHSEMSLCWGLGRTVLLHVYNSTNVLVTYMFLYCAVCIIVNLLLHQNCGWFSLNFNVRPF